MYVGLFVVGLVGSVAGHAAGPPASACATMHPGPPHEPNSLSDAEKNSPPFEVRKGEKSLPFIVVLFIFLYMDTKDFI